jgi:hypothetical protein
MNDYNSFSSQFLVLAALLTGTLMANGKLWGCLPLSTISENLAL